MHCEWFRTEEKLHLSVQYFKDSETSSGETGCSSNFIFPLTEGFVDTYNKCVTESRKMFHLPQLKTIKSESDVNHPIIDKRKS